MHGTLVKGPTQRDHARALAVKLHSMRDDPDAALAYLAGLSPTVLYGAGDLKDALADVINIARQLRQLRKYRPDQLRDARGRFAREGGGDAAAPKITSPMTALQGVRAAANRVVEGAPPKDVAGSVKQSTGSAWQYMRDHLDAWWQKSDEATRFEVIQFAVQAAIVIGILAYLYMGGPLPRVPSHDPILDWLRNLFGKAFDPNQPRDDHGRWTDGDGQPLNYTSADATERQLRRRFPTHSVVVEPQGPGRINVRITNMDSELSFVTRQNESTYLGGIGVYDRRPEHTNFAREGLALVIDAAKSTNAPAIDLYAASVGSYLWPRIGFELTDNPDAWATSRDLTDRLGMAKMVIPDAEWQKVRAEMGTRDETLPSRLAALDYELTPAVYQSITQREPVGKPTLGKALLIRIAGNYSLPRAKFHLLERYAGLRKVLTKGYPEFNPDQPRNADGTFGGGRDAVEPGDPRKLKPDAEAGYLYHGTNAWNFADIREDGELRTHGPSYGTEDQDAWPDGSTDDRSYWNAKPSVVESFYPAEGKPVLLRARTEGINFRRESGTSDSYTRDIVPASKLEYLGSDGKWHAVAVAKGYPEYDPNQPRDEGGRFSGDGDDSRWSHILERSDITGRHDSSAPNGDHYRLYMGSGTSVLINRALRDGKRLDERHASIVSSLDNFISGHKTTADGVVYRGVASAVVEGLKPGDMLSNAGFTSTTMREHWAAYVPLLAAGDVNARADRTKANLVMMEIFVPKGTNVGPGFDREEAEIVLPRGTRLRYEGETDPYYRNRRGGLRPIHMTKLRFSVVPPVAKGYPEFDPDQPRAADGTFSGGGGAEAVTMRLTERERTILLDRLTIADALSEVITDRAEGEAPSPYTKEQVEEAVVRLEREVAAGTLTIASDLDREIIEDVVDGNTFVAGLEDLIDAPDDNMTQAQANAWRRTARALNAKLKDKLGITSEFPE